jgi:hypothetical protein
MAGSIRARAWTLLGENEDYILWKERIIIIVICDYKVCKHFQDIVLKYWKCSLHVEAREDNFDKGWEANSPVNTKQGTVKW